MKSFDSNFPIGSKLILGLEGPKLTEIEKKLLSIIRPAGVIFFKRNFYEDISWIDKFENLISEIKEVTEGATKLFSIDYEGGRVHRFPDGSPSFPYAQDWASKSYLVAKEMANFLNQLGINLSYAPCVDIDLENTNPVIGKRSFSADPEVVTQASLEFYHAFEEENIISCAKHFPGHGRTTLDSHFSLPVLDITREELNLDLTPYIALIKEKIPLIMSSHIIFNQIDPEFPASLSHKILISLLKEDLQFEGLVCSDDFDMRALNHIDKTDRFLRMITAGTDLVVMGNGMDGKAVEDAYRIICELSDRREPIEQNIFQTNAKLKDLSDRYNLI